MKSQPWTAILFCRSALARKNHPEYGLRHLPLSMTRTMLTQPGKFIMLQVTVKTRLLQTSIPTSLYVNDCGSLNYTGIVSARANPGPGLGMATLFRVILALIYYLPAKYGILCVNSSLMRFDVCWARRK